MTAAPTVTQCVRCGSTAVVAITYVTAPTGLPRQGGVCATCTRQVRYFDKLSTRMGEATKTTQEGD